MTTDELIAELKRRGHFPLLIISQEEIADHCAVSFEKARAAWEYIAREYDADGDAWRSIMDWAKELIEEGVI